MFLIVIWLFVDQQFQSQSGRRSEVQIRSSYTVRRFFLLFSLEFLNLYETSKRISKLRGGFKLKPDCGRTV